MKKKEQECLKCGKIFISWSNEDFCPECEMEEVEK